MISDIGAKAQAIDIDKAVSQWSRVGQDTLMCEGGADDR